MAKPLVVEYQGQTVNFGLSKIDRTKLYGYVDTEVVDESGKGCEVGTLLGDGHSLVGKGGTGLCYLSPDGLWRKKAELRPVDMNGNIVPPVKSSFDTGAELRREASIDEYLSHNINLVYQLTPENDHAALMAKLRGGSIFVFPFSYRGGVSSSAGFLLMGADGNIFLCVGTDTAIEFVGLRATAATVVEEEEAPVEEESLDFSLV
jgi:hypothetical protein